MKGNNKQSKSLPNCEEEEMSTNKDLSDSHSEAKTPANMCRYVISLLGRKGFFGIESIVQLMLNDCKTYLMKRAYSLY